MLDKRLWQSSIAVSLYRTCVGEIDELTECAFGAQGMADDAHVSIDEGKVVLCIIHVLARSMD